MKKALLIVAAASLLAGCSGLSFIQQDAPADTSVTPATPSAEAPQQLTEKEFVELSANIVCLKVTAPNDDAATRKAKAAALITKSGVTESAFTLYRAGLDKDTKKKEAVSYAIVGRIAELCPTTAVPQPAVTPTADPAAPATEPVAAPTAGEPIPTPPAAPATSAVSAPVPSAILPESKLPEPPAPPASTEAQQ